MEILAADGLDPHFTFLYQSLKDIYTGYDNYIFATTAAIIGIIGWLFTSKDAREYIAASSRMRIFMTLTVLLFLFVEIGFSYSARNQSLRLVELLKTAIEGAGDYALSSYYQPYIVGHIWIFISAHAVLYAFLLAVVYSMPKSKTQ